jgi:hypothetical protein
MTTFVVDAGGVIRRATAGTDTADNDRRAA